MLEKVVDININQTCILPTRSLDSRRDIIRKIYELYGHQDFILLNFMYPVLREVSGIQHISNKPLLFLYIALLSGIKLIAEMEKIQVRLRT